MTTDFRQDFLAKIIPLAVASEAKSKVPAEIIVGQAILESNWGRSKLTLQGKNLFGIKANPLWDGKVLYMNGWEVEKGAKRSYTMEWRAYNTWQESVDDHSKFLSKPRYAKAFTFARWQDFLHAIHIAGYATDPTYANQIIAIAKTYNLEARCKEERLAQSQKIMLYEQKAEKLSQNDSIVQKDDKKPAFLQKFREYIWSLIR